MDDCGEVAVPVPVPVSEAIPIEINLTASSDVEITTEVRPKEPHEEDTTAEPPAKKVRISPDDSLTREQMIARLTQQEQVLAHFDRGKLNKSFRLKVLSKALASKEEEVQELLTEIQTAKQTMVVSVDLKSVGLDSTPNVLLQRMLSSIEVAVKGFRESNLQLMQNRQTAPDTDTTRVGPKVMAKVLALTKENEELEHQLKQGPIGFLNHELSVLQSHNAQLNRSISELTAFVLQMDDELEKMGLRVDRLQKFKAGKQNDSHETDPRNSGQPQDGDEGDTIKETCDSNNLTYTDKECSDQDIEQNSDKEEGSDKEGSDEGPRYQSNIDQDRYLQTRQGSEIRGFGDEHYDHPSGSDEDPS